MARWHRDIKYRWAYTWEGVIGVGGGGGGVCTDNLSPGNEVETTFDASNNTYCICKLYRE